MVGSCKCRDGLLTGAEVAQFPRIIIGERVVDYLEAYAQNTGSDIFNELNRSLAERSLGMIAVDFDGNYILDYLGSSFKESITKAKHYQLFSLAFQLVNDQLEYWRKKKTPNYQCDITIYSHTFNHTKK